MKNKRQIALNRLFNFLIINALLLGWLAVEMLLEHEYGWGIGLGISALLLATGGLLFTPYCYSFDDEGLSLCYVFLPNERYLWRNIRAIEVDWDSSSSKASFLEFLYASIFSIRGKTEGEPKFYMQGHIRKTFRTKRLLEKYWDGTITGYFFEDIKKSIKKRRDKSNAQIKAHLTDEIVPLERESRAKAREWLSPFVDEAKQRCLEIKTKYIYITSALDESRSRPDEGYTYTLLIEIARPNERNQERIVVLDVDLIYVRLGKTAYKGVLNELAEEELRLTLRDALDKIYQNGIEVYCGNS